MVCCILFLHIGVLLYYKTLICISPRKFLYRKLQFLCNLCLFWYEYDLHNCEYSFLVHIMIYKYVTSMFMIICSSLLTFFMQVFSKPLIYILFRIYCYIFYNSFQKLLVLILYKGFNITLLNLFHTASQCRIICSRFSLLAIILRSFEKYYLDLPGTVGWGDRKWQLHRELVLLSHAIRLSSLAQIHSDCH